MQYSLNLTGYLNFSDFQLIIEINQFFGFQKNCRATRGDVMNDSWDSRLEVGLDGKNITALSSGKKLLLENVMKTTGAQHVFYSMSETTSYALNLLYSLKENRCRRI